MALVDLKRTKEEKKSEKGNITAASPGQDDYPYGTRIHLGEEELDKLGIDSNPKVGDGVHVHGHGHVTSVSEDTRENGKKHRRVEIHLKHLEVKPGDHKPGRVAGKHSDQADGMKAAMDGALAEAASQKNAEPDGDED